MRYLKINSILCMLAALLASSCTQDPYDGIVSHERAVEAVSLGDGFVQVGPAVIDRTTNKASVQVLMEDGIDLSKVKVLIQSSYKSKIAPASGEVINFEGNNNQFTYTVTAESGEKREWTVELVPFTEEILGSYNIQQLVVYGGTGPEYGGGAVMKLTDKPWDWPDTDGPSVEEDNVLTFEFTGVTSDGKTYGTITNNAGTDGLYADYQFIADPATDVNYFYRTIPKGTGTWQHDYVNNKINFVFDDGTTYSSSFIGASTIDLGNGLSKTITDNSFDFTLYGVDDWNKIYSDYDKFVRRPRRFWIDVKKN